MMQIFPLAPIDYLLIGHITNDRSPQGDRIGGTASFASLTARALGLRVGVITSCGEDVSLEPLNGIPVVNYAAESSTSFENIYTSNGRIQYIRSFAANLDFHHIPEPWRSAPIVHLAPVAREVEPSLVRNFTSSLIGVTPQGWLRDWDSQGRVTYGEWPEATFVLGRAGAAVISTEDVLGDESRIEEMASASRLLAVTEADKGTRLFWNGDVRRFRAQEVTEVDPTGAGDIFAAAFFCRLYATRDPWESARFATQLAAVSVTRPGLSGIPTPDEINACLVEVF
jgi:pfkB family carbohydrate kinase